MGEVSFDIQLFHCVPPQQTPQLSNKIECWDLASHGFSVWLESAALCLIGLIAVLDLFDFVCLLICSMCLLCPLVVFMAEQHDPWNFWARTSKLAFCVTLTDTLTYRKG